MVNRQSSDLRRSCQCKSNTLFARCSLVRWDYCPASHDHRRAAESEKFQLASGVSVYLRSADRQHRWCIRCGQAELLLAALGERSAPTVRLIGASCAP
jgi:hypothetical protein